jgi:hypothetical protein
MLGFISLLPLFVPYWFVRKPIELILVGEKKKFRVITRNFRELTRNFRVTRNFRELTRNFRVITRNFREVTRNFRVITRNFCELTRNFRVITRNFRVIKWYFRFIMRNSGMFSETYFYFQLYNCHFTKAHWTHFGRWKKKKNFAL